jgi:hypothetical protein
MKNVKIQIEEFLKERGMMFCKHKWSTISEAVTESKYEHSLKVMGRSSAVGKVTLPWQLCDAERKHILTVTCDKCGKIKQFVNEI